MNLAESVAPESEAACAQYVTRARQENRSLRLGGSFSRAGIGRPVAAATALSTRALTGIFLYEPAEMVIGAKAGTPLAAIEAKLDGEGQMLAFEPMDHRPLFASTGAPTIGAIAAGNISGPRRIWAGAARDSLVGIRFINGAGEIIKSGGRVMKNVTGLDLVKLQAGAWGTLGLITEVCFKVVPKPEIVATLVLRGLSDGEAIAAMAAALGSPYEITGAAHLPAGIAGETALSLLRIEGFGFSVDYRSEALARTLRDFGALDRLDGEASAAQWRAIRDCTPLAAPAEAAIWRLSLKPAMAAEAFAAIRAARPARGYFDWGGGLLWVATEASEDAGAAIIRAAAKAARGYAILVRAPEAIRRAVPVFDPEIPAIAALSARIRAALDPDRLFNPGLMHAEP